MHQYCKGLQHVFSIVLVGSPQSNHDNAFYFKEMSPASDTCAGALLNFTFVELKEQGPTSSAVRAPMASSRNERLSVFHSRSH